MPVSVVVGGQFGSEGKGKVALSIAREMRAKYVIRVGGPNSGHTVFDHENRRFVFQQLPTAALLQSPILLLAPGSYINLDTFMREVQLMNLSPERIWIHPNACVIREEDARAEKAAELNNNIGSTQTGVGAAVIRRIERSGNVKLARDSSELKSYVRDYSEELHGEIERGARVVVEGTQGFGLSVLHSPHYPFCTSRDTTAAGFISEAGLSPLDVDDVVVVIRAFPIRVSGNSGPLPKEITWETISSESGAGRSIEEFTSVTKRLRRVARFDGGIVRMALAHNRPTRVVLNHLDYIEPLAGTVLTPRARQFVSRVEESIGRNIDLVGTSPVDLLNYSNGKPRIALAHK